MKMLFINLSMRWRNYFAITNLVIMISYSKTFVFYLSYSRSIRWSYYYLYPRLYPYFWSSPDSSRFLGAIRATIRIWNLFPLPPVCLYYSAMQIDYWRITIIRFNICSLSCHYYNSSGRPRVWPTICQPDLVPEVKNV